MNDDLVKIMEQYIAFTNNVGLYQPSFTCNVCWTRRSCRWRPRIVLGRNPTRSRDRRSDRRGRRGGGDPSPRVPAAVRPHPRGADEGERLPQRQPQADAQEDRRPLQGRDRRRLRRRPNEDRRHVGA